MDMIATEEDGLAGAMPEKDQNAALRGDYNGNTMSDPENKFQRAIAAWRGIDFSTLITRLDTTASEVVAHQKDSLVQRKELAQKTKDFRKLDDAGKLAEHKGLLKAYQTFIDLLTNQSKTSSSAFLQLYSAFSEAPDPYPLLEASIESLVLSEDTLPKLTEEKNSLRRRLEDVTSQLEGTERSLSEERLARGKLEQGQDHRAKETEARWTEVLQEKQDNWESREKVLDEKVENLESLLRELKANHEVSQRLGQNAEHNPAWSGGTTATELEIVHADLEKTTSRLTVMEARNEQLRLELAQAGSQSQSARSRSIDEDPAFQALQTENSALLRRLDSARLDKDVIKQELEKKRLHTERQKSQIVSEVEDLRLRIEKMADYDELRRELEMIKSIEFSTGDDDDVQAKTNGMNAAVQSDEKESLEQLLMTRNKKLSNELTTLRVSRQSLEKQLEDLQQQVSKTNTDLEKSQNLTASLENDLLRVQGETPNAFLPSSISTAGSLRNAPSTRKARASPTSSIISGFETGSQAQSSTLDTLRSGAPVGGGSGILPMVQAQRDRFKQKNTQLEEDLSKTYATVSSLRQEIASLQKDNLSLYEKTRYVSTYSRGQPTTTTSSSSAYSQGPSHTSIQMSPPASASSLDRYKSQYEANISPFAAFRGRESARAYKRMSVMERVVYSMTRIILANRLSRNLFAGYCLVLHLLVFLMLYRSGATSADRHSESLGDAAADVVAAAAAGGSGNFEQDPSPQDWQRRDFNAK